MKFTTSHIILSLLFTFVISTPAMAYIPEQKPYEAFVIMGLSSSDAILEGQYEKAISLATRKTKLNKTCLLYTSPSPRDRTRSRMPSSA